MSESGREKAGLGLAEALARLEADDWDGAHDIVAGLDTAEAAWVHAHLHRVEGDLANARYWYRRAGHPEATGGLAEEKAALLAALRPAGG